MSCELVMLRVPDVILTAMLQTVHTHELNVRLLLWVEQSQQTHYK